MIKELRDILGAKNVLDDEQTLAQYSTDQTLNPLKKPCAVVKPKNTADVQKLVQWANTTLTPLVPASSGVHFTGGTLPEQGGVIVDMSGMNKILEIDPLNRKAKIEPGVTWQQLNDALKEHDQMALNPLFPHPQASALTSSVEREPMLIPKYEYSEPALTMEVVLPTGDIFRTGTASDEHTEGAYPEGPGIDFWRMFLGAQGTMGIVCWLNVKTEYRPKQQKAFFMGLDSLEDCADPIYKMQRRHVGNECFVLNRFMMAQLLSDDPKDFGQLMAALPNYTLVTVLAGAPRRPLERIAYEEEALMEIAADFQLQPGKTVGGIAGLEATMLDKLRNLPAGDYWKARLASSSQEIFFTTTMDKAADYEDLAMGFAASYGLNTGEVGVYMQPLERGRACHLQFSFPCEIEDEAECETMASLLAELSKQLIDEGAFFTRPYGPLADMVYRRSSSYTAMLKELKKIYDPKGIMNPGKLCF